MYKWEFLKCCVKVCKHCKAWRIFAKYRYVCKCVTDWCYIPLRLATYKVSLPAKNHLTCWSDKWCIGDASLSKVVWFSSNKLLVMFNDWVSQLGIFLLATKHDGVVSSSRELMCYKMILVLMKCNTRSS